MIVFFSKECHNVVICQKGFVLKGGVSILAEGSFLGHPNDFQLHQKFQAVVMSLSFWQENPS